MTIKYVCDVCGEEKERNLLEFDRFIVKTYSRGIGENTLRFEVCKACSKAILKPVKHLRSSLVQAAVKALESVDQAKKKRTPRDTSE